MSTYVLRVEPAPVDGEDVVSLRALPHVEGAPPIARHRRPIDEALAIGAAPPPFDREAVRRSIEDLTSPDATMRQIGEHLFGLIAQAPPDGERSIVDALEGLTASDRVVLQVSPELRDLPWEALAQGPFVLPFARDQVPWTLGAPDLSAAPTDETAPLELPLRVAVVICCSWSDGIDAAAELEQIELIVRRRDHHAALRVIAIDDVEDLDADLERCMQEFAPHVLHVIGHASVRLDANREATVLLKHGDAESPEQRTATQLAPLICRMGVEPPRLVVLNTCHGATRGQAAGWGFTELFMQHAKVPALISMQAAVQDEAAAIFSGKLYRELFAGAAIDVATARARKEIQVKFRLRDLALPRLVVSAEPDSIIRLPEASERLEQVNACAELSQSRFFVNQDEHAWNMHRALSNEQSPPRMCVVHGGGEIGRTAFVHTILRRAALRQIDVRYVSLSPDPNANSWIDILRGVRDVRFKDRRGFVNRPWPEGVFDGFTAALNHALETGRRAPIDLPSTDVDAGHAARPDLTSGVIKDLLRRFQEALSRATGGARAIVAIDALPTALPVNALNDVLVRQLFTVPSSITFLLVADATGHRHLSPLLGPQDFAIGLDEWPGDQWRRHASVMLQMLKDEGDLKPNALKILDAIGGAAHVPPGNLGLLRRLAKR